MSHLLEIKGLKIGLSSPREDPTLIVDTLDLSVRKGEILCLVGESGSGKSMTALSIMGLLAARGCGPIRLGAPEWTGIAWPVG